MANGQNSTIRINVNARRRLPLRIILCFLFLFALSGLILGSMGSEFISDIFGGISRPIVSLFGASLAWLIKNYFKEIKGFVFVLLFILSACLYIGLIMLFVD